MMRLVTLCLLQFRVTAIQGISTEQEASPEDIKRVAKKHKSLMLKLFLLNLQFQKEPLKQ